MAEGMPPTMKAAQLRDVKEKYQLITTDVPKIKDHEILVKIHAAGFCHSDLQVVEGEVAAMLPLIPSHEGAGVIAQIGSKCNGSWKIGDRVGVLNFKNACKTCPGCVLMSRQGKKLDPRFCENRETAGFKHNGCFAEYLVSDPETTFLLPDSLSFDQAAPLTCAGATVWGALEKAVSGLESGAAVAIIGIGGLGHLGIQFCKALGFRTIAIDSRDAARSLATEVPAGLAPDLVVDSSSADAASGKIYDFTHGEGIAAAVMCTDSIEANSWALSLLRIGGTLVVLGLPHDQWRFDSNILAFRELIIRGSYVASVDSARRMMKVVEEHKIRSHVTQIPFSDLPDVVERYQDKDFKGRLVVRIA